MIGRLPARLRRIFHRTGKAGKAFENSIAGLVWARRHGWKNYDLDAGITKDGIPVAEHGPPSGPRVAGLTFAQLRKVHPRPPIRRLSTMFRWARRLGLTIFLEVKFDPRFEDVEVMRGIKRDADRTRARVLVMTLQGHGDPIARLRAAKAVGFETVLLAQGNKPPTDPTWKAHVDYVRGNWP